MVGSVLRVRYELTQLLHEGPIFATYSAKDRLEGREVCVRIIRQPFASETAFVNKLREVSQRYGTILHPGLESLIDVDEDEGAPFLVSEITHGMPLADRIRKLAPFSVSVAVSTAISLCEGLDAIHSLGLTHGDVSAQNAASLPDGQVRLQLAGLWQAYAASPIAASIALPSMSPYLAPEVSAGAMPSPGSDVYAAGVLLYELLSGRLPYNADTPVSMALKHATASVPTVRMYNPAVPMVLDEIVKKALSKDPETRYKSARDLLSDLRVLQDALRFGKTVTWPISSEPLQSEVDGSTTKAVRPEPSRPVKTRVRPEREPSDVPLFLWILIVIFGTAAATMLGIWLWFNVSKPTLVKVPPLDGLSLVDAREALRPVRLELEISSRKSSEKIPADRIISTDPEAGIHVREGSRVRVVLSTGSQLTQVPDLKGDSMDQARSILQSAHLELDENYDQSRSNSIDAGLVVSQTPSAGAKVDQSTKVKVTLSSGKDGEEGGNGDSGDPSAGTSLYTLKVHLTGLTKAVNLRIDMIDDTGTRTIYEQEHEPEDLVEGAWRGKGKHVTFRIYYDDELVKEVAPKASEEGPPKPSEDNGQ